MMYPELKTHRSASEEIMWEQDQIDLALPTTDRQINERYIRGEGRIVIETNREKLPGFVRLLKEPNYMDLRPFYQRRPRWSVQKQSLLIESFIMNIPVPPVFLYEKDYNSFEVMDGQQRITAVRDFYSNAFPLKGLETWPELNGRYFNNLPDKIKAGIDRRSITSIVLLKESTGSEEEASNLRETVFERLNTGGVKLERQEIRNALYRGKFNDMIERISRDDLFRHIWGLPPYVEAEIDTNPELLSNPFYAKMGDKELILRFFALRHVEHYKNGMQGFLDLYMRKTEGFQYSDISDLFNLFNFTLRTIYDIYGDLAFCVFNPLSAAWDTKPHRAFYDAVMVGIQPYLNYSSELSLRKQTILEKTKDLFVHNRPGTFTGRGNTKSDIRERIDLYNEMIAKVLW